jgi:hypothetical protein
MAREYHSLPDPSISVMSPFRVSPFRAPFFPVKPARGHYRRLMQVRLDLVAYHARSQVETVISMIKRRQGPHVHGRSYWSQCRDLHLLVLTHNVMILVTIEVFYRAVLPPFLYGRIP